MDMIHISWAKMKTNIIFRLFVLLFVNHIVNTQLATIDLTSDEFQLDCLISHNNLREKHCSLPIKYSPKLKHFATRRATLLVKTNGQNFGVLPNPGFGENINRFKYNNSTKISCKANVDVWYREKWRSGDKGVGLYSKHFAQVVWNSTQRIGCAAVTTTDPSGYAYIVCNYFNSDRFGRNSFKNIMSVEKCDQKYKNRIFKTKVLTTGQWLQGCIKEHKRIRNIHSVDPLIINDEIFQAAQKRAQEMAQKGFRFFRHKRSDFGENIHWTKPSVTNGSHSISCNISIGKWYREIDNYDWDSRLNHNGTYRHFAQLVWKSTTTLGCAQVQNIEESKGGVYTVCLYQPKAELQDVDLHWENVLPQYFISTSTDAPPRPQDYERVDELDEETELEKEFRDVEDIIDTRVEHQRQTPAVSLEDMFIKTSTEKNGLSKGFDRNEYIDKRKG